MLQLVSLLRARCLSIEALLLPSLGFIQELVQTEHITCVLLKLHWSFPNFLLICPFKPNLGLTQAETIIVQGFSNSIISQGAGRMEKTYITYTYNFQKPQGPSLPPNKEIRIMCSFNYINFWCLVLLQS